jgi:hypothetical protein
MYIHLREEGAAALSHSRKDEIAMDLKFLIDEAIKAKEGNKEFALFYYPTSAGGHVWSAEIGNPVASVSLGESTGEIQGEGGTPEEAVNVLLRRISERRK